MWSCGQALAATVFLMVTLTTLLLVCWSVITPLCLHYGPHRKRFTFFFLFLKRYLGLPVLRYSLFPGRLHHRGKNSLLLHPVPSSLLQLVRAHGWVLTLWMKTRDLSDALSHTSEGSPSFLFSASCKSGFSAFSDLREKEQLPGRFTPRKRKQTFSLWSF